MLITFAAGCAAAQVTEGSEVQITTNASHQNNPAIYNDTIVWTDGRNVNITEDVENMSLQDIFDANIGIYMYNLSTGEEMQLSENGSAKMTPAIYGDIVIWEDYSNVSLPADEMDTDNITLDDWLQFDVNIHMYNISSGESGMIVDNPSWQGDPAIYGELVVWHDLRNGNFDIYAYNLSSGEEMQITGNESNQMHPAVYGDRIVWEDLRNGNSDIYMYDLSSGEGMRITNNTSDQVSPAIYGDVIVWEDHTNVNLSEDMDNMTPENFTQLDINIHMYNLSTREETRITSNASAQINPAIHGDRIVWEDLRNGTGDIRMYDLSTREEELITEDSFWQEAPDIYEDRIVWTDYRNGNQDIYVFDLSSGESGPIIPPIAVRDDDFDDRDDDFDDRDDDFDDRDDDNDNRDDDNDNLDDNNDDRDDDNDDLDDDNDDQDDDNDD
ncbi:cell surface protein [Methanolobus psychrophilus R15]|nr:cell surface protein [Methanolobus psychrophilus R15]